MRMGGKSKEGMNFWYDQHDNQRVFYAQYGQRSLTYTINLNEQEAKAWRKDVYARAEHAFGIVRGRYASNHAS